MPQLLFASCPQGLEELLKKELIQLGATECHLTYGGVNYRADDMTLYRTLLWSRIASRILLPLTTFKIYSDLDLYSCAYNYAWTSLFFVNSTFVIHFTGTNQEIRHSQYGALRVKDAIVDHFIHHKKQRPDVAKNDADIRIHAYLNRYTVTLSLDLSGEPLNQRGYRLHTGQAPIKENLAAALLIRSGWKHNEPLLDPMCGSGTLLIEAAMMAKNQAPGLLRKQWGFYKWLKFNQTIWDDVVQEAKNKITALSSPMIGYDCDPNVIHVAKHNANRANLADEIEFDVRDVAELSNPYPDLVGTIICNPPYGERLNSEPELIALYSIFGQRLKQQFGGWTASLFSGSEELLNCLKLRSDRQFKAKNGAIDCIQKNYSLLKRAETIAKTEPYKNTENNLVAVDFANRLKKNRAKIEKWAKQQSLECYRLYDADLPDYNVAIDRYKDKIVIQEYAAPKQINPAVAKQRLYDVIHAAAQELNLSPTQIVLKTRERQKGKQQYQAMAKNNDYFSVTEYGAKFWVNVTDYLDTGLFIDHRLARKMIGSLSKGKDFLNLFAYTATATVYAGLGAAKSTTTVDMSRTYLEWAERNLELNHLTSKQHRLVQADCLYYLEHADEQFDLIFIDPPTFSNSKRMQENFDVQRDHLMLMTHLKRLLSPNGTIIFSNNYRNFKLDYIGINELGLQAKDITEQTISLDFKRNKHIHCCFVINHL